MIVAGLLLTRIDFEPLGPQRLARLAARVVELARLTDDDRAGADDENALEIGAFGMLRSAVAVARTRSLSPSLHESPRSTR